MGTRSLTTLDYLHNGTHKAHRRETTLPLDDLQQTYLPAQPVLSSRTVDIDLPGTRTYRQKSALDIIEEQQRLIRQLYMKPRVPVSAPPRHKSVQTARSESNIGQINIEVKGRPFTSGAAASAVYKENSPVTTSRRPKTAGPLKHVSPLTDCHRSVSEDRDFLAISQSSQKLRNELNSYWKTEVKALAVGKFVRGQKKILDGALPGLDSWLTFGGDAGVNGQGIVDAITTFKNAEEYYNIKGSVGSQVIRQLQKGRQIRIGINGVLQTQNFKVKKRNNNNAAEERAAVTLRDNRKNISQEVDDEKSPKCVESTTNTAAAETESTDDFTMAEEVAEAEELVANIHSERGSPEIDFGELVISPLDEDFEDETTRAEVHKSSTTICTDMPVDTAVEVSPMSSEEAVLESLRLATPLSWSDQCSKENIKIIHAKLAQKEMSKPVVSETFPVKFQKLIDAADRPKLAEVKSEGFKIKQRSAHESKNSIDDASKVKVVYIDPLTTEEDNIIKGLSVDSIISHKLEERSKVSSSTLLAYIMHEADNRNSSTNSEGNKTRRPHPASSRSNYSNANSSVYGDRSRMYSPKLKVNPVHSSAGHKEANLRIMSANSGHTPQNQDVPRNGKPLRKLTPAARPLLRTSTGQGSSINAGPLKGEPEYIKIISQLKITSSNAPAVSLLTHGARSNPGQISAGRNSPEVTYISTSHEAQPPSAPAEGAEDDPARVHASNTSSRNPTPTPTSDSYHDDSPLNAENDTEDVEFCAASTSPTSTAVAPTTTPPATFPTIPATITFPATFPTIAPISIPTGDEEFSSQLLPVYTDNDDSSDLNNQ